MNIAGYRISSYALRQRTLISFPISRLATSQITRDFPQPVGPKSNNPRDPKFQFNAASSFSGKGSFPRSVRRKLTGTWSRNLFLDDSISDFFRAAIFSATERSQSGHFQVALFSWRKGESSGTTISRPQMQQRSEGFGVIWSDSF